MTRRIWTNRLICGLAAFGYLCAGAVAAPAATAREGENTPRERVGAAREAADRPAARTAERGSNTEGTQRRGLGLFSRERPQPSAQPAPAPEQGRSSRPLLGRLFRRDAGEDRATPSVRSGPSAAAPSVRRPADEPSRAPSRIREPRAALAERISRPDPDAEDVRRTPEAKPEAQRRIPIIARDRDQNRPSISRENVVRKLNDAKEQPTVRSGDDKPQAAGRTLRESIRDRIRRPPASKDLTRETARTAEPAARGIERARPVPERDPAGARLRDTLTRRIDRTTPTADRITRREVPAGDAPTDRRITRSTIGDRVRPGTTDLSRSRTIERDSTARDVKVRALTSGQRSRDLVVLDARRVRTAETPRTVRLSGRASGHVDATVRVRGNVDVTHVHTYYRPSHVIVHDVIPPYSSYRYVSYRHGYPGGYGYYDHNYHHHDFFMNVSLGYYSAPVVVPCATVRYVYPVWPAYVAPTVVYYNAVYVPPVYTPIIYSTPVYVAPVVYRPVIVPVCSPVVYYYHPIAYYYPVYATVLTYPTYLVEPAPARTLGFSFGYASAHTAVGASVAVPTAAQVSAVEPAPQPLDPVQEGLNAIRANNMAKARRYLSQAVINDPDDGTGRMLYTAALMADGQYTEAAISLRRALQVWSTVTLADLYLPSVFGDEKVFTRYSRDLREYLSDHPERVDAWLLAIWTYAFAGQPDEAALLLAEARRAWPADPDLITLERLVREDQRQQQQAQAEAEQPQ